MLDGKEMLSLDSEEWGNLDHAYGAAANIPELLRALPEAPVRQKYDSEPWFTLWSSLCHQGDVYSSSFAAVPHIIRAAATRAPEDRAEYLLLASSIEAMRHRNGAPPINAPHELSYQRAIKEAIPLTLESLKVEPDKSWFQALLSSLAAFRGYPELSQAVADLERVTICPKCDSEYVQQGFDYFEDDQGAS